MDNMSQTSDLGGSNTIDTLRGRLDARSGDELLAFWARHGFAGPEARERLGQVVCVLRDRREIAGVSSVFKADVGLIGQRRFWVFRSLLPGAAAEHRLAMIRATFEALDAERLPGHDDDAIGLCVPLDAAALQAVPADARWSDPPFIYAGYLPDGRQARIGYFSDQFHDTTAGEGWEPAPGYRVELFAEQDDVTDEDVIEFWTGVGAMSEEEARRRVDEVLLVGIDPAGRPIGVATTYLARNEQLCAEFWHYRTFVAEADRAGRVGLGLVVDGRDHLERRFTSGDDRRGIGMLAEIEFEPLKRLLPKGTWRTVDLLLIGDNARGDHVRVYYFAGARAPGPEAFT
jgi:hypothetical protein